MHLYPLLRGKIFDEYRAAGYDDKIYADEHPLQIRVSQPEYPSDGRSYAYRQRTHADIFRRPHKTHGHFEFGKRNGIDRGHDDIRDKRHEHRFPAAYPMI